MLALVVLTALVVATALASTVDSLIGLRRERRGPRGGLRIDKGLTFGWFTAAVDLWALARGEANEEG